MNNRLYLGEILKSVQINLHRSQQFLYFFRIKIKIMYFETYTAFTTAKLML